MNIVLYDGVNKDANHFLTYLDMYRITGDSLYLSDLLCFWRSSTLYNMCRCLADRRKD